MIETIEIVSAAHELRRRVRGWRRDGLRVALVPTMGALHDGHLALVSRALEHADRVVASVFVNPMQFGPDEDFERYPRSPDDDAALLATRGCHLVFVPDVETIYPPGDTFVVDPEATKGSPARGLEGDERPGHFRGVATVVAKLLNLVTPHVAVFGEKDAQQLAVVRAMVRALHFDVEIASHPTVRETDGLAMSSRNAYLTAEQRTAAPRIHETLQLARRMILDGERKANVIRDRMARELREESCFVLDYAEVVDPDAFQPVATIEGTVTLPVAVRAGTTRLIDNITVELQPAGLRHSTTTEGPKTP